jgi:hypothetical protein
MRLSRKALRFLALTSSAAELATVLRWRQAKSVPRSRVWAWTHPSDAGDGYTRLVESWIDLQLPLQKCPTCNLHQCGAYSGDTHALMGYNFGCVSDPQDTRLRN